MKRLFYVLCARAIMSVKIGNTCQSWGVGELWVSLFDKLLKGDIVSLCDLFCTRSDEKKNK